MAGLAFLALPKTAYADFKVTVSGTSVTFTSDGASGTLILGEQNGLLSHNAYLASSSGLNSAVDLDGTLPGDQALPLSQVTEITINGGSSDDTLVINNPAGSIFAPNAVIRYNGGDGYDTLVIQGGGGADFRETYSPGPTKDAGLIETTNGTACQVIYFTGLEPVKDNTPAATATVNGTPGDNSINYSQGPGGGIFTGTTGLVTVDNFESFEFNNKANLVINGLAGSDTINLNNPTTPAGLTGTIAVNGGDPTAAGDTLIMNSEGHNLVLEPTAQGAGTVTYFGGGLPNTPFTGIEHLELVGTATNPFGIDGTAGDDQFEYTPGATPDTGTLVGTMNSGVAQFPLVPVTFVGIQQAGVVVFNVFGQQGGTDSFVFDGTPADDQVSVTNGGVFGGVTLSDTVNGTLFANLNLNNMASVTAQGNDGDDTFTHDGNVQVALAYSGGGHSVGDVLNYTALSNAATTIDYGAGTITSAGSGPVNFVGIQKINETSAGTSPALTVKGTAGGDKIAFAPTGNKAGTVTLAGVSPVTNFTGTGTLTLNGQDGDDIFNVIPSSSVTVNVTGGNPTPPASPGDSLGVNTAGTTGLALSDNGTVSGLTGGYTFTNRMPVNFQQIETLSPLLISAATINATEGVPFSNQTVATYNAAALPASNFTATINWGDGTATSNGTIVSGSNGSFTVTGSHTYAGEGSYKVLVDVTDLTTSSTVEADSTAIVADAPLSVSGAPSPGSPTTISGAGGNSASVTPGTANAAFNVFKAAIGGVDHGNTATPQAGGFRTINWDGVALTPTDGVFTNEVINAHTVGIPLNRFQARGMELQEIYAVSDDGFASVNPSAAGQFPAFSPTKTFAMFNDNTIDFSFVLPSAPNAPPVQAVTRGFGAIFLDVEKSNTTSVEFFDGTTSLGKFFVPAGASSGDPVFFGVLFQNPCITNVHIELGNAQLFSFDGTTVTPGDADNPPTTDLVATDDFVYAEPTAVPTGISLNAIIGAPLTAKVASFTDADPNGQVGDYTATVDWGDGSITAGTITPNASGGFDVTGTHTYFGTGAFTVTTTIKDTGGSSVSALSTVSVSAQPSLSIGDVTVTEPASGGSANAAFTVTLSAASTQPVTVDFSTADGTATAPADYQSTSGTLTFPAGVTTRTINVPVNGDTVPESDETHFSETFFVNLANANGATFSKAQGVGTINKGDATSVFQFSSPTANVNESASPNSVTLTVTRTGDTSGAASVHFETSDGTASQKNKYTFGSGALQWAPGDASPKTITVLLTNEAFVEGNKTFTVTLSNPSPTSAIGNPGTATVTIVDDDTAPTSVNPIDSAQFFVRQHYLDFLGREADASGLNFWTSQITACGADQACVSNARVNVSAAFFLSIEFQETSGFVIRTQRAAFGRQSADPTTRVPYLQFMRDTRQIGAGVIVGQAGFDTLLESNKQAYATQLVNDPAFLSRFPIQPAANYVDSLFASAAVTPTAAERAAAINAFGAGGTAGRVAALRSVADSNSLRQAELNPSFVLAEYYGYLRRNPTDAPDFSDAGYQFWLSKLNSFNGDFVKAEMVKAFITSTEYRQRFGP